MATTTATTTAATSTNKTSIHGSFIDWLKPRRSVAIARLRNNTFALVVALLVTQLAPIVPSATTCLWMLIIGRGCESSSLRLLCWIELVIFALLSANILQSYIAIRYPPPSRESMSTPAKRVQMHTPSPRRPLKVSMPKIKSHNTPLSSSTIATPGQSSSSILLDSSPFPFQSPLSSSFSSSLLSSPLAHRSRQIPAHAVRSLRGSLLNQLEATDDEDL